MIDVQRLVQAYKESMERALGPGARIERGTTLVFRHPRCGLLVLFVNASDPERFHLVLPAFLHSEQGLSRAQLVELSNVVNGRVHGVKFAVGPGPRGEVSASVELLMPLTDRGEPHRDLLDGGMRRALGMLIDAAHGFGSVAIDMGLRPTPAGGTAARPAATAGAPAFAR